VEIEIQFNQTEDLPFSKEEICEEIILHIDQIDTDTDEACFLLTNKIGSILYWEGNRIIVESVVKATDVIK